MEEKTEKEKDEKKEEEDKEKTFDEDENSEAEKNKKLCEGCAAECCKYLAIEIDAPEKIEDFEDVKWYVTHKNVRVYVDEDNEWHVEFKTPCQYLDENDFCSIYSKRPEICRDYSQDECPFHNEYNEKYAFEDLPDVEKYIDEIFKEGKHELPDEEDEDEEEEEEEGEDKEEGDEESECEEDKQKNN